MHMTRENICKKRHIAFDLNMCNYMMERKKERENMKRFKTLICICLILIVVSSMAIVIGRYAISKNVIESSSEMQLAESKKNADEVKANYDNIEATWNTLDKTLRITDAKNNNYCIPTIPDEYKSEVRYLIIESENVNIIQKEAFKECSNLTTVYIKDYYKGGYNIEDRAFWGNNSLTTVIISHNVQSIGYAAFAECPNLTKVVIKNEDAWTQKDSFDKRKTSIYCRKSAGKYGVYNDLTSYGFKVIADEDAPDDIYIRQVEGSYGWTSKKIVF